MGRDRGGSRRHADERRRIESTIDGAMALAAGLTFIIGTIYICDIIYKLAG